ncbi:MAG: hypothetical protein ACE5Z5_06235 [Candidatus Bathyarchaeia archaeon]
MLGKERRIDAVVFGLGVNLPHRFPIQAALGGLWTYLWRGRVMRLRYERRMKGKRILFHTTRVGTGAYWDLDLYLPSVKYAVGVGYYGVYTSSEGGLTEGQGDVFIPSSAILLPSEEGGEFHERKPSEKLHKVLMEKAERHGLRPYEGRVCTVYDPMHGRWEEAKRLGCVGQDQETWLLFDRARRFGNDAASVLIASDVGAKSAGEVFRQAKERMKTLSQIHKKLVEKVVPESLLYSLGSQI